MTEEERDAREWLRLMARDALPNSYADRAYLTILRMLDRPALPRPEDVSDDVLREMCLAMGVMDSEGIDDMRGAYRAMYAHLTAPPKPKKVEAWAVVDEKGNIHALTTDKYKAWDIADRNHYSAVRLGVETADE